LVCAARGYVIIGGLGLTLAGCGGDTPMGPVPLIGLGATSATFAAVQGGVAPAPQTIAVRDAGGGTLTGLSAGPIVYTGASGWLTASLDKTTAPATLTLTAAPGSLASGSYSADVPVKATASNSPQHVAVSFLVLSSSGGTTISAAGRDTVFLSSPNTAVQLTVQAGSQYLIAVVNTDSSHTVTEDFTLAGALLSGPATRTVPLPAATVPAIRSAATSGAQGPTFTLSGSDQAALATMQRLTQNHLAMLEANREIYERLGNPRAVRTRLQAGGGRLAPISAAVTATVGTVNKVYVKKQLSGDCTSVDSIGARTVAVGQHVIVLADTNRSTWPQSQRPDSSFYQSFATEYDTLTWPHILTNVGNPLAYDTALSNLGKVTVTITPVLNGIGGGIVAFVNGCDFLPFATSGPLPALSNVTEMFYSLTPASPNGFTVTQWEKELRATSAHETKHLVSYTDRILNNSPVFEQIWLEEGLAQESSEIWMRHFNQATWKGNANFQQTVACEINLGVNAPCDLADNKPLALAIGHLPFLFMYLQAESQSNSEGLGVDTPSNYGAGWAFARWATDQYATPDEGTFIQSLVNEPSLNGLANLSLHTGQSIPLLLVFWNLASAIYATPTYTAADARITIPSFNFADIFKVGQTQLTCSGKPCGLFTSSGTPVYPVQPIALTAGAFSHTVHGVPGTAAAFFLLSASTPGTEALQLESGTGGTISTSSGFRIGIIRTH
jgi:hypothetical protein